MVDRLALMFLDGFLWYNWSLGKKSANMPLKLKGNR